jgi:TolB-like protein/Tfp pilus assembly protein PilF
MFGLIRELRRRKVFRGAAIYLLATWAALQVVDVIGEAAGFPAWTMRVLLYAAVVGFPLAVFLGWRYEFGQHGLVKTKPVDSEAEQEPLAGRDYLAIAVFVVVSIVAGWQIIPPLLEDAQTVSGVREESVISANSIAVLPFVEIGQGGDGYLADGLSETLTHVLGQVEGLSVTARTSSLAFKDRSENILDIAKALRVAYVVEGSVQQAGSRVRIIARLIESINGTELWSANINKEIDDIFVVQDEISQDVVAALGKVLHLEEEQVVPQYRPVLEAYRELVLGINAQRNNTMEGNAAANEHFRRAVELDPGYALAYVRLAENIVRQRELPRNEIVKQARPLVEKALELEPLLAEAHIGLAMMYRFENEKELVEPTLKRAIELNPSLVEAHVMYSSWLTLLHRLEESLEHAKIAAELDPQTPETRVRLASAYWSLARAEQAIALGKEIVEEFPEFPDGYYILTRWYMQMGQPGRSMLYTRRLYEMDPENPTRLFSLCQMHWQLWDFEENQRCYQGYLARFPDDLEVRKQLAATEGNYVDAIRIAREHANLEPWNDYRKVQLAFFISLTRDHAAVREVLSAAYPALLTDDAEVNDWTQWPARMLAQALIETGDVDKGLALLDKIEAYVIASRKMQGGGWFSGIEDAQIYAVRGDVDAALDALETAVDNDWSFYSAGLARDQDPSFDVLIGDPRYEALVDRIRSHMAEERAWYEANRDQLLN